MIANYVLILGIGHLLGDFYFQNEDMAKQKDEKYKGVLWHSLVYYFIFMVLMLPICSLDMLLAATIAALAHFLIDTIKYILLKKKKIRKSGRLFLADQCVHAVSIFALAYGMEYWHFAIGKIGIVQSVLHAYGCDAKVLAQWLLAILFIHVPVNIFIQNFLGEYKPKGDESIIKADSKAGRRIGTVERLIMLIFLSMNQYAAVGFVLTAKSVARYDKIAKDEKFAEYYLLGTLVSSLCVILCRVLILA